MNDTNQSIPGFIKAILLLEKLKHKFAKGLETLGDLFCAPMVCASFIRNADCHSGFRNGREVEL